MADNPNPAAAQQPHSDPGPRWLTDVELVSEWGFKPDALDTLFGESIPGPNGEPSWLLNHVMHVDRTVIKPAVALLEASLQLGELADHFEDLDVRSGFDFKSKVRPSPEKAVEMLKGFTRNQ